MDKNKAHDILHAWNGGMAENCPVCGGQMNEEESMAEAQKVAGDNYTPRVNPNLPLDQRAMYMGELDSKDRKEMDKGEFAYIDSKGGKHLPINDANHVRNALARFNQTHFDSEEDKKKAMDKILAKAKELGIKADPDNDGDNDASKEGDTDKDYAGKKMSELHSMIDIMKFSEDGNVPSKIKMIPVGKFKTQAYGEINITKDKLLEMKKHFDEGVRAGVPIDFEHGESMYKGAAAGWLKGVTVADDGMYGDIDWTDLGKQKITSGEYKFYSPEFHFNYVDPEHSFELKNVLTGGGLVNKPMFKELPPLTASEKNLTKDESHITLFTELIKSSEKEEDLRTMNLKEIVAKEKSTRSSKEQEFLVEHKDELTFAEAKAEGFVQTTAPVKASEGQVVITAAEKKALEEKAALGVIAHEQLRRTNLEKEVKTLTFSEKGAKIATDQVEATVDLMMKMSEEDQATFKGFLEKLPEKQLFTETGTTEAISAGEQSASALTEKAREIQAANKGMTFSDALSKASAEHPELVKGYQSNKPVAEAGII